MAAIWPGRDRDMMMWRWRYSTDPNILLYKTEWLVMGSRCMKHYLQQKGKPQSPCIFRMFQLPGSNLSPPPKSPCLALPCLASIRLPHGSRAAIDAQNKCLSGLSPSPTIRKEKKSSQRLPLPTLKSQIVKAKSSQTPIIHHLHTGAIPRLDLMS